MAQIKGVSCAYQGKEGQRMEGCLREKTDEPWGRTDGPLTVREPSEQPQASHRHFPADDDGFCHQRKPRKVSRSGENDNPSEFGQAELEVLSGLPGEKVRKSAKNTDMEFRTRNRRFRVITIMLEPVKSFRKNMA